MLPRTNETLRVFAPDGCRWCRRSSHQRRRARSEATRRTRPRHPLRRSPDTRFVVECGQTKWTSPHTAVSAAARRNPRKVLRASRARGRRTPLQERACGDQVRLPIHATRAGGGTPRRGIGGSPALRELAENGLHERVAAIAACGRALRRWPCRTRSRRASARGLLRFDSSRSGPAAGLARLRSAMSFAVELPGRTSQSARDAHRSPESAQRRAGSGNAAKIALASPRNA